MCVSTHILARKNSRRAVVRNIMLRACVCMYVHFNVVVVGFMLIDDGFTTVPLSFYSISSLL